MSEDDPLRRRFTRDLTSLLSLPAFWSGRDPDFVLRTLLEALETLLPVAACYGWVARGAHDRVAILRGARQPLDPADPAWAALVACADAEPIGETTHAVLVDSDTLYAIRIPLGYVGEAGRVVAASHQPSFPDVGDLVTMRTAVTLAAAGLETARIIEERDRAQRAKDEFLAMLGHELRNPLAPILTALELMTMRAGGRKSREQVVIERQVAHLRTLVDDLLDVSRITRGKLELRRERADVSEIVSRALEVVAPLIEERGHEVSVAVPLGIPFDVDPTRMTQVVTNLLTNAAESTPNNGRIDVRAEVAEAHVTIRIADSGVGIPSALLPDVFDMFVQGPRGVARSEGGLGIGLTLVKNLVAAHGGTVTAESPGPGGGSVFSVRLPCASPMPATIQRAAAPVPAERTPRAARIMVVDDNRDAAELTAELLMAAGHAIEIAHSGEEAIRQASRIAPDIVLLDIGLPDLDGYQVAAAIAAQSARPRPLFVALSGYGQPQDRRRSSEAGFAAHLVKPVDPDDLLDTLWRVISDGAARSASS